MKKLILFLLALYLIPSCFALSLIDSYSETNADSGYPVYGGAGPEYWGQTFLNPSEITLVRTKFYIQKSGSPTGNAYAKVYAHTGTFGEGGLPTGAALATSDAVDVSALSTSMELVTFNFTGDEAITLSASTHYAVVFNYSDGDAENYVNMGFQDAGDGTGHDGNQVDSSDGSTWYADGLTLWETPFYIYGGSVDTGGFFNFMR